MPAANDGPSGIKVVYLRPDAWPMHVLNPGGDDALTVAVESEEVRESEFIPTTWVQMESPVPCSSRSSPSNSALSSPTHNNSQRGPSTPRLVQPSLSAARRRPDWSSAASPRALVDRLGRAVFSSTAVDRARTNDAREESETRSSQDSSGVA